MLDGFKKRVRLLLNFLTGERKGEGGERGRGRGEGGWEKEGREGKGERE
jgi:hypothetical protein